MDRYQIYLEGRPLPEDLYGTYKPGDTVRLEYPHIKDAESTLCSSDVQMAGIETGHDSTLYEFVMPSHDVHITINKAKRGMAVPDAAFTAGLGGLGFQAEMNMMQSAETVMKKCPECRTDVLKTARFCSNCGYRFEQQ